MPDITFPDTPIKSIRKPRACYGCGSMLMRGQPAVKCAGVYDWRMWSVAYHIECREAEVAMNNLRDYRFGDEWYSLHYDLDPEDYGWLWQEFPAVAIRKGLPRQ